MAASVGRGVVAVLMGVLAAGCGPRPVDHADVVPPATAAIDAPVEDVPPATVPDAAAMIASATAPTPPAAPGPTGSAPAPGSIAYGGFGPASYGGSVESLRIAWGKDLDGAPSEPRGCHHLTPSGGSGLAFMVERGAFVRTDVSRADVEAPGGGRVGMTTADIQQRYGPRVDVRRHEYVDTARVLRVADPAGGNGVLVFETDADGTVAAWRTGIAPQVDYAEGCS